MKKSELRKKYLEKRNRLSEDEILLLSEKIFENFILQFKPIENQKIHCFSSIPEKNEVNTKLFLNEFFKNKARVFVPKIAGGNLISIEINPETQYIKNSWGISEPESNEDAKEKDFYFVIVPLLYCDNQGDRVGYGKGFYDNFLKNINSDVLKIGINYFSPQEKIDDIRKEDIPLDYLVTPTEILSFSGFTSNSTK